MGRSNDIYVNSESSLVPEWMNRSWNLWPKRNATGNLLLVSYSGMKSDYKTEEWFQISSQASLDLDDYHKTSIMYRIRNQSICPASEPEWSCLCIRTAHLPLARTRFITLQTRRSRSDRQILARRITNILLILPRQAGITAPTGLLRLIG